MKGLKLRQIADNVHGTVYVSELESKLMSTAFFYRLHDIYQSSTVYLTFPCNRTKRYEHSYGTMGLAGMMFFSMLANTNNASNCADVKAFLGEGLDNIKNIVDSIYRGKNDTFLSYQAVRQITERYTNRPNQSNNLLDVLFRNLDAIRDPALEHFALNLNTTDGERKRYFFSYQCLLEAIRIVALFHDVGHPPYSHILENVIKDLFTEYSASEYENNANEKQKELISDLQQYFTPVEKCGCLGQQPNGHLAFHERVGLKIVELAMRDELEMLEKTCLDAQRGRYGEQGVTRLLYHVIVTQFVLAIWCDTTPFFSTIHEIVDGYVDADRLDYVVRDTKNAGVSWGKVPYKRIIESLRLYHLADKNRFVIAFPQKMCDDIDDMFVLRYKISARINYHHRSIKTSLLLQNIVKALAKDYLESADGNALCENIKSFWDSVNLTSGPRKLSIIQWNDSVMITHLYEVLVKFSEDDGILCADSQDRELLYDMLREFLLNQKFFYSVYKRQFEVQEVIREAFEPYLPLLNDIRTEELKVLDGKSEGTVDCTNRSVRDSIMRLEDIEAHIGGCHLEILERFFTINPEKVEELNSKYPGLFPSEDPKTRKESGIVARYPHILVDCVKNVLQKFVDDGKIKAYLFQDNMSARMKNGLPEDSGIYVYGREDEIPHLYDCSSVGDQISALMGNCLLLCAYIEPTDNGRVKETINNIRTEVLTRYKDYLKAAIVSMWPNVSIRVDTEGVLR